MSLEKKYILGGFLVNLILSSMAIGGYFLSPKENAVSFDKKRVEALFIKNLAEHRFNKEALINKTLKFKGALKSTLAEYATLHDVIIFDKNVVFSGGRDVTEDIIPLLAFKMRRNPS